MKKLNNQGFAISTLLYGLMIMSLLIVLALLSNLGTNRKNTTTFVDKIEDELNRFSLTDTSGDHEGGAVDENGREFIANSDGWYKIELWGAAGGGTNGGKGAYVSGIIYLEFNDHLYFYTGAKGEKSASFNGGGAGSSTDSRYLAGGGATDVRLINGAWNDEVSLDSRIMVAAGGGGAGSNQAGGYGGTLFGGNGNTGNASDPKIAYGGTPSAGGAHGVGSHSSGTSGSFGIGGTGGQYLSGGGSGYYGGGASGVSKDYAGSGAGGSSFIAGYAGVQMKGATNKALTKQYKYHRGQYDPSTGEEVLENYTPIIYNGMMIPGVNSGAGKFEVTKVSSNTKDNPPRRGSNVVLNNVRYIRDTVSSTDGSQVEWEEVQAVKDGVNVAYGKGNIAVLTNGEVSDASAHKANSGTSVTIDLGAVYNLDEIVIWHKSGKAYKNNVIEVSSDGSTWRKVKDISSDTGVGSVGEIETVNGVRYNSFNANSLEAIPEGDYYIFSANSDNQVLTSYEEDELFYARMEPFVVGKDNVQTWHLTKVGNGYRIINTFTNYALDIEEGFAEIGAKVDLLPNNPNNSVQEWTITPLKDGYYTIGQQNLRMGYESDTFTKIQSVTQEKNQRWKFVLANY